MSHGAEYVFVYNDEALALLERQKADRAGRAGQRLKLLISRRVALTVALYIHAHQCLN